MSDTSPYSFWIPPAAGPVSERSEHVRRAFGLSDEPRTRVILEDTPVPSRGLTYITGWSGAGKSTLLRLIRERHPEARVPPEPPAGDTALIDLFEGDVGEAIRWLSRLGLGEARLFSSPARVLSEGQRARLGLALLLAQRPGVVVIDEFLSTLDRTTAKVVAYNFQKVCRRQGVTAYVATAHGDLEEALAPDHVLNLDFNGRSTLRAGDGRPPSIPEVSALVVEEGDADDYPPLARFHYMDLENEIIDWRNRLRQVRVIRLLGESVGIALYTRVFPRALEEIPFFQELNERILYRYRTVIHPTFRGLGLFKRLEPVVQGETRWVLGVSALGRYYPYHVSMGYESLEHPRCQRLPAHDALEELLRAGGVPDCRALHRVETAQACYEGLPAKPRARLESMVKSLIVQDNVDHCLFVARLAELPLEHARMAGLLRELFQAGVEHVPASRMGELLSQALHFPMQAFYKRVQER